MISSTFLPRCGKHIWQAWSGGRRRRVVRHGEIERLECRTNLSTVAGANWETFVENGPSSNRVDIVFLGDGYTSSEIDTVYKDNIDSMLKHMFFEGEDPFPRYQNFFNFTRIDVISPESGVDDPVNGIKRNSALNATYLYDGVTDRLASIDNSRADAFVNKLPFKADMKYVTLNSSKYGGAGGPYAVFAGNDPSSAEIALHEQGHSFADLADEYFDPGRFGGGEPSAPNVTKSSTGNKWAEWLGYDQPGIGLIGAYEGGMYAATGIYRPSDNSKMRSLGSPFDAIGREAFIQHIYDYVNPLDAALKTDKRLSNSATLWADVVDPLVIQTQWLVDGQKVQGATGPYFVPAEHGFGSGNHTVTLQAVDDTDWVRRGQNDLRDTRQWTIGATTPTPGLTFSSNAGHLDLNEGGDAATFELQLSAQPTQTVTISLVGNGQLEVSPQTLVFTPADWNTPRTLTVSARTDNLVEGIDVGDIVYQVTTTDAAYGSLALPKTRAIVRDGQGTQPNDKAPVISKGQVFTILANLPRDGFVGIVGAKQGDAAQTLEYAISGGDPDGTFAIDPVSGMITVAKPEALDINTRPTISLTVRVTVVEDPALFDTASITIKLVDLPVLAVNPAPLTGVRRGKAAVVDSLATFTAAGTPSLNGAILQVAGQGTDDAAFNTKDTFAVAKDLGIRISGKKLLSGKLVIGSVAGATKGKPLGLTFNAAATPDIVQSVLRSISFKTTDKNLGTRTLRFQILNIDGLDTNLVSRQIQLVK